APPASSRSQDAPHAGRTSTSSSPPPPTAYSSSPRCPGAAHPASETRTSSPPTAPPPASSPTQSPPRGQPSEDTSARSPVQRRSRLRATIPALYCCRACRYTPLYFEHNDAEDTDARPDPKTQTGESASPACRSARAIHPPQA